ncbi:MAG TPA: family 20 glycosylhydrolase [Cyclobacteriaceae bacterium]|nr:family 20 glycosylhydrolase [Cyclobacteriaceae bacterium]
MKNCLCALLIAAASFAHAQQMVSIIPQPVSVQINDGSFRLEPSTSIGVFGNNSDADKVARYLSDKLRTPTGFLFEVKKNDRSSKIRMIILKNKDSVIGKEGYLLSVFRDSVSIQANEPAGLFYGTQTFLQLLPAEIESKATVGEVIWEAPCVSVKDYPRFAWRGLMLDVSRHFFTKEQVKQFIDEMIPYKYNVLHWHLTDDQEWRIEIKSLPRLTSVGAWRAERVGDWGNFTKPSPDEPKDYGGFYTQEDIKEIVQYAKDRFVSVLPEIDIPGHSLAMVASYPEVSCTPGQYQVNSGEKFMDWYANGFTALIDNTLCPANEIVYQYLDKVFTEVAQLFPFEYIHMGGDECAKNFWEKSDAITQLMKKEKLKDMHEVQSYFVKRVEKIIESKKKKLIGWDEILEGGLAPNAAVMSWRGIKGGIEAASMGHKVVMSPNQNVYIDLYQGDPICEPKTYGMVRLNKAYQFEPVPDGVKPELILGGQANLWTERVTNMRHAQYMTWPRSFAISESLWSPKEKKNWDDFVGRVEKQFRRFDAAQVKYATTLYDAIFNPRKDGKGTLEIELTTEVNGIDIYYSFDESNPDRYYPKYTAPLMVPKDAVTLKVVTYRDGQQIGKQINMPIDELKRRAKIK